MKHLPWADVMPLVIISKTRLISHQHPHAHWSTRLLILRVNSRRQRRVSRLVSDCQATETLFLTSLRLLKHSVSSVTSASPRSWWIHLDKI
ncbi:hypothetical protein JOB18_025072 [Solea senegalensis]|uniref:Uncharacterized protein n=1 Tax=Solea senegalensis TaxID=28829 RepID=A0AAV6PI77_SOLSE|nr:hypothetical protein JOB18_025072 [Solea senegalensis]